MLDIIKSLISAFFVDPKKIDLACGPITLCGDDLASVRPWVTAHPQLSICIAAAFLFFMVVVSREEPGSSKDANKQSDEIS